MTVDSDEFDTYQYALVRYAEPSGFDLPTLTSLCSTSLHLPRALEGEAMREEACVASP